MQTTPSEASEAINHERVGNDASSFVLHREELVPPQQHAGATYRGHTTRMRASLSTYMHEKLKPKGQKATCQLGMRIRLPSQEAEKPKSRKAKKPRSQKRKKIHRKKNYLKQIPLRILIYIRDQLPSNVQVRRKAAQSSLNHRPARRLDRDFLEESPITLAKHSENDSTDC